MSLGGEVARGLIGFHYLIQIMMVSYVVVPVVILLHFGVFDERLVFLSVFVKRTYCSVANNMFAYGKMIIRKLCRVNN
jgi:hypothetical protein